MSESQKKHHIKACAELKGSQDHSIIKFQNYGKQLKANFDFYADFETLNLNVSSTKPPSKKMKTKKKFQNSFTCLSSQPKKKPKIKDTFQFLSSSFSNLVENLKANKDKSIYQNFAVTYKYFKRNWEKKLKQKGCDIE